MFSFFNKCKTSEDLYIYEWCEQMAKLQILNLALKTGYSQNDFHRANLLIDPNYEGMYKGLRGKVLIIDFGLASGSNPGDVNLLNELMNSVEPRITPDQVQNHIRWSALTAWEILDQYKEEYQRLVVAFEKGLPIEECIAVIEGEGEL